MTSTSKKGGRLRASIVSVVLAAAVAPALAQNYRGLLKNTPVESFNAEDRRLFQEASRKALNDTPAGETVTWSNPATESHGELKVLKDFTWKDNRCREVHVHNESHGANATNTVNMCKVADKWRAVSASELAKR